MRPRARNRLVHRAHRAEPDLRRAAGVDADHLVQDRRRGHPGAADVLPQDPTTEAYGTLFAGDSQTPVLRWFLNSMLAATGQALLVLAVASMAAYALARMEFRGKKLIFALIIATLFVPGFILLIPNFLMVDRLGWLDTLWALIVPGAASAFGVFFLRQFFLAAPRAGGGGAAGGRQPLADLHQGDPAAVQAGPGHPGGARLPDQLERLHLAGLRAVQPGELHAAAGPGHPAGRVHASTTR